MDHDEEQVKHKRNWTLIVLIIIVIMFIALLIVTIGCIMYIANEISPSPTINESNQVCQTGECVELSSSILSWMNTTADPCNDFFECMNIYIIYHYILSSYYDLYRCLWWIQRKI